MICREMQEKGTGGYRRRFALRETLVLLVVVVCVLFATGSMSKSVPQQPEPAAAFAGQKGDLHNTQRTVAEIDSSECWTQGYAGEPAFAWPLPYGYTMAFAMRFDATEDTLKLVQFYAHYDPPNGTFGDDTFIVRIFADDGFGFPGTELAARDVPPGSYVAYPETSSVDFSDLNLVLDGPFHVALSTSAPADDGGEAILSDDGQLDYGRSSYYYEGQWYGFDDPDYNFCIWVTACHCPPSWSLSGHKYWDFNRTKQYEAGQDPPLSGWQIELWKGGALAGPPDYYGTNPVLTDINGEYIFHSLGGVTPGTYYVKEILGPWVPHGWAQTLPATVGVNLNITSNFGYIQGPIFLNDTCDYWHTMTHTYLAGTHDNFVGPEPSTPSQGFHDYLVNNVGTGSTVLEQFDVPADNHWFGHTFYGLWDPNYLVVDARLCMQIKVTGGIPSTDALYFGDWNNPSGPSDVVYGILMNQLCGMVPDQVYTICLDLDDLPPWSRYSTNIIATLQDGDLDVFISDDTEVDWLELTVTLCCEDCYEDNLAISTGWDQSGSALIPSGNLDPDWVIGVAPTASAIGPAKVVDPYPGWAGPDPNSNWITALTSSTSPSAARSAPMGLYLFQYCFCADTLYNPELTMTLRADNRADVNVNKANVGSTGPTSWKDPAPASFFIPTFALETGGNVLSVLVHNDHVVTGIDVEGYLTANYPSLAEEECCSCYTWGDIDDDGIALTVADMVYLYDFLRNNGSVPIPLYRADMNGDCVVDTLDYQRYYDYFVYGLSVFDTGYPIRTCCCPTAALLVYPSSSVPICGDADSSQIVNISDAVYMVAYIFGGGPAPKPLLAGDCDCNSIVNISDVVYLISYIFGGGSPPCMACKDGSSGKALQQESAGEATLTLKKSAPEDASPSSLEVNVTSRAEIAGVQLEFRVAEAQAAEMEVSTTPRSEGLQLFKGFVGGMFRVGLVDLRGESVISAGAGPIIVLRSANVDVKCDLISNILCDRHGRVIEVTAKQGEDAATLPYSYSLYQNHPNPFNPSTQISFALPRATHAKLVVFNILGQEVATLFDEWLPAGRHAADWDGTDNLGNPAASGIYLYRLQTSDYAATRKMLLLK